VIALGAFALAVLIYGRFIGDKILELDPTRQTPAHTFKDGVDFVPTNRWVLFGHHFASIAGLGPIVGPAVAVYWGWLPAVLWVLLGSIFAGAVHDLTALGVSLRHDGRSIGDLTKDIVGPRVRLLFLCIIFFFLALAMGLFAFIIGTVFTHLYPEAIIPVFVLIGVAAIIGAAVYRGRATLGPMTLIGVVLTLASIGVGIKYPVVLYRQFIAPQTAVTIDQLVESGAMVDQAVEAVATGLPNSNIPSQASGALEASGVPDGDRLAADVISAASEARTLWIYLLLAYAFVASVLPVWLLLQPRDYLNSFQLYIGLVAMVVGVFLLHPTLDFVGASAASIANIPALRPDIVVSHGGPPPDATPVPWFPLLFITIACGAISGFHNLVSSGTTARQLDNEKDAHFVAYSSMITEGLLALLVILACAATFVARDSHWTTAYASWTAIGSLGAKLGAFITGAAVFVEQLGINRAYGAVFISVMVVGFAMTTLDSATRLLRFNVEELSKTVKIPSLGNRYLASLIAVIAIGFFALLRIPDGAGAMEPAGLVLLLLFGTSNQLLAGLGLLTVSVYLWKRGKNQLVTLIPMVFMLSVTMYAMILNTIKTATAGQWAPAVVGGVIFVLAVWIVVEAAIVYGTHKKQLEQNADLETAAG